MDGWPFILRDTHYESLYREVKDVAFGEIIVGMHYLDISCLRDVIHNFPSHKKKCTPDSLQEMAIWIDEKVSSLFDGWEAALLINYYFDFMDDFVSASRGEGFDTDELLEPEKEYLRKSGMDPTKEGISLITVEQLYNWITFEMSALINVIRVATKRFFDNDESIANLYGLEASGELQKISLQIIAIEGNLEMVIAVKSFISAVVFDIKNVLDNDVSINICANCGRYFIPANRSDTKYCTRKAPQDELKTCQEYGAYNAWVEKSKKDETYSLYRKIYMKKQMMAKRNPDIQSYRESFEQFKTESQDWKRQVKAGALASDDYLAWLKQIT